MSEDRCNTASDNTLDTGLDASFAAACRNIRDSEPFLKPVLTEFIQNLHNSIKRIREHQQALEIPFFEPPGPTFTFKQREKNLDGLPGHETRGTRSLDIFDTCLVRLLDSPLDIFSLLGGDVESLTGMRASEFAELRRETEQHLREQGLAEGIREDVSHDAVYDELQARLKWDDATRRILQEREFSLEKCFFRPDPEVLEYFLEAREQGTPIVFTSEMYYPGRLLQELLESAGFSVGNVPVYSSGEYGLSKGTGNLYRKVLEDIQAQPLIHIGDNPVSDGEVPRSLGVQCAIVRTPKRVYPDLFSNVLNAVKLQGDNHGLSGYWESFGYKVAGPVHFAFATHLYRKCLEENYANLFFLSRDGWFPRKVFRKLQDKWGPVARDHYIYASREFLGIGSMEDIGDKEWDFILKPSPLLKVRNIFERLGIPERTYLKVIQDMGLPEPDKIICHHWGFVDPLIKGQLYEGVCRCLPDFLEYRAGIADRLRAYLGSSGIFSPGSAFMDLGWGGSSFEALAQLAPDPETAPTGLYFALLQPHCGSAEGYFAEGGTRIDLLKGSIALMEFLFGSPEPTARDVVMDNASAKPVFRSPWRAAELEAWEGMERGILKFTGSCLDLLSRPPDSDGTAMVEESIRNWLYYPDEKDIQHLGAMSHAEGWGTDNRIRILPRTGTIADGDLYREALCYCPWKPGLQRQLHVASSSAQR